MQETHSNKLHPREDHAADTASIEALIGALASKDGFKRQEARLRLVEIGQPAVPALITALSSRDEHTRWEAAKALNAVDDPSAAPALVVALEDVDFGIRWLAADGLIERGVEGLKPLLSALIERPESIRLREGAHHVLRALGDTGLHEQVAPVLDALQDIEPLVTLPWAARRVLETL